MYDKVSTNLNFVEREKNIETTRSLKKASTAVKRAKPTHSMTAPPRPTENPISAMC